MTGVLILKITLFISADKTYTFTNSVEPEETARNKEFWMTALSATMDIFTIEDRRVYFRNSGMKGIKSVYDYDCILNNKPYFISCDAKFRFIIFSVEIPKKKVYF